MAKVIAEIVVCQDCLVHIANGDVTWGWANDIEKEDVEAHVSNMYNRLFFEHGKGHVTTSCGEPEIKHHCCDLCRNYDGEDDGAYLLGEYHQASILS